MRIFCHKDMIYCVPKKYTLTIYNYYLFHSHMRSYPFESFHLYQLNEKSKKMGYLQIGNF
jgi:hypothetical protein